MSLCDIKRSGPLSATIIATNCKLNTRLVAVYPRNHCNIGSKRACYPLASDVEPWRRVTSYVVQSTAAIAKFVLGCRLAPEMIPIARNFAVWAVPLTSTLSKVPILAVLRPGNPLRRNSGIFHRCTHAGTDSLLLFQKWWKSVQDKWPKGRVVLVTVKKQNTFWHPYAEPLGQFLPFFCVSVHRGPSLIFLVSSI